MSEGVYDDVVARAERALADVGRDPRAALAEADAVVAAIPRPRAPEQVRAVVTAHRAAGLALRELSELEAAEARMRRAVRIADRHALPEVGAEARMSLAFTLMERGRMRAALAGVDNGLHHVDGLPRARLLTTRALVYQRTGRHNEAAADYRRALPVLRDHNDSVWEARLLNNRSMIAAMSGRTEDAVGDLSRAREIYVRDGQSTDAADALWNIGYIRGMGGDIPAALRCFDEADAEWDELERPEAWAGRAEVMLRAGLAADAVACARRSIAGLAPRGWYGLEAEARIMLALTLLALTPPSVDQASDELASVRALLARQDRPEWRALADYAGAKASLLGAPDQRWPRGVDDVAQRLASAGWRSYAADLRIHAGRAALSHGEEAAVRSLLIPLASATRTRELDVRGRAWLARAMLAMAATDHDTGSGPTASPLTCLRRAWDAIDEYRRTVGATELRAGAAAHATSTVDLALEIAKERGSAELVFDWCERGTAAVLRFPPAHPPEEASLAEALATLRWAQAAHDEARLGRGDQSASRLARINAEAAVIRLARRRPPGPFSLPVANARQTMAALDDTTFVMFAVTGSRLSAVVLGSDRASLHDLAAVDVVSTTAVAHASALRRTMTGFGPHPVDQMSRLMSTASSLNQLLLRPIEDVIGSGRLVISPGRLLAPVTWSLLDACRERAVSVTPSASVWLAAHQAPPRPGPVVAAHGPHLAEARDEIDDVVAAHSNAIALRDDKATVAAVLAACETASILHLAAHGTLRRDNPLFSSLTLADGELTGHDLETSRGVPPLVVLSACDSGRSEAPVADEAIGLAWTLLSLGSRTVVAPVSPVPDSTARRVMAALHPRLAAGMDAASALAATQAEFREVRSPDAAAASAFIAFGA